MFRRSLLTASVAPSAAAMTVTVAQTASVDARRRSVYTQVANVPVGDHFGRHYRFRDDLIGERIVAINFMYVGCGGICPLVTANLRDVQDLLGDRVGRDIFMYSITLWPELETPDVLRAYAEQHAVRPGWLFLTGAADDIVDLRRSLGFRYADPERDRNADEHTGMLRYGNAALDRWSGTSAMGRPEWIAKAITSSMGLPDEREADVIRRS